MHKHNGNIIEKDRPFTINGTKYPWNWLNLTTAEEKAAVGIVYEADPPEPKPEPKPEPAPLTVQQQLQQSDWDLIMKSARMLEEIADERIAAGKTVGSEVIAINTERKRLRVLRIAEIKRA